MKNTIRLLFFVFAMAALGAAQAQRALVPIVNYDNVPVATKPGSPPPTREQVGKAILDAAARLNWETAQTADGKIVATLHVNKNKHTVAVEIAYSPASYSVKYVSSINMKYRLEENGTPVIHPAYNQWITALMEGIGTQFRTM